MQRWLLVVLCCIAGNIFWAPAGAQEQEQQFHVSFLLDYSAAEEVIEYYAWKHSNTERLVSLKGNQLAIATSLLLAQERQPLPDFVFQLEALRSGALTEDTRYGLSVAAKRTAEIRALLKQLQQMQLHRRISATIAAYFPADVPLDVTIPVYVVAFGNDRAAAVVRRVRWENNRPVFTGDDEGEPVVLANVSRFLEAGDDVQTQALAFMATLAHESFHAVYSLFRQSYADSLKARTADEYLLELVHNEGIAYYLSLELQRQGRPLSPRWFEETARAIRFLNTVLVEMRSPATSTARKRELLLNANLSGSFSENYGVAAGQRMAYEIDTRLGRSALVQTLTRGFREFFRLYQRCTELEPTLPAVNFWLEK